MTDLLDAMPDLFSAPQAINLNRVRSKIARAIIEFCQSRVGCEFHMHELERSIAERIGVAPDSPSRILRALRQAGTIEYEVTNRRDSRYRVLAVRAT